MSNAQRVDVPTGCVPNYRDFVRHLWCYEDPRLGPTLKPPPVVYRCVIEDVGEELEVAQHVCRELLSFYEFPKDHITIERDGTTTAHGISFANAEVLHLFVAHLAGMAKYRKSARALGDFMMWSLGFRWV